MDTEFMEDISKVKEINNEEKGPQNSALGYIWGSETLFFPGSYSTVMEFLIPIDQKVEINYKSDIIKGFLLMQSFLCHIVYIETAYTETCLL